MKEKHVDPEELHREVLLWQHEGVMSDRLVVIMLKICESVLWLLQFSSSPDKDDLVQHAWLTLLKIRDKLSSDKSGKKMFAYLQITIKNCYYHYYRVKTNGEKNMTKYRKYVTKNCVKLH